MIRWSKQSEEGVVTLLVAVSMVVFFGMLALSIDIGGLLVLRRELVTAADSGSLAGAQSCATGDNWAEAQVQANAYIDENYEAPDGAEVERSVTLDAGNCDGTVDVNGGELTVVYKAKRFLGPAQWLGWEESQTVPGDATAEWGTAEGSEAVAPMIVNATEDGKVGGCVLDVGGTTCAVLFNNKEGDIDYGEASHWGSANLDPDDGWDVDDDTKCSGAPTSDFSDWLQDGIKLSLSDSPPTYVCHDNGAWAGWAADLQEIADAGGTLDVPVNDPTKMVDQDGNLCWPDNVPDCDKYAVVGFIRMKLIDVLKGAEGSGSPGTPGTPADGGTCTFSERVNFSPGTPAAPDDHDLDDIIGIPNSCTNGKIPTDIEITELELSSTSGGQNPTTTIYTNPPDYALDFLLNTEYDYEATVRNILWQRARANGVDVEGEFEWSIPGDPGTPPTEAPCGHDGGDGNEVCVVFEWTGRSVGGIDPCRENCPVIPGALQAIRLK